MKHRCGDVSRETSQRRAFLRGGELKGRLFGAEIIYFLACHYFLFAAKNSVLWRRCGRKMGRSAATAPRPKSSGSVGHWGMFAAAEGEGMQMSAARMPSRRRQTRLTPCGRGGRLSRLKFRGLPDVRGLNQNMRSGSAESLGVSSTAAPASVAPEQARPDAFRKRRTSCDVRLERSL